MEQLKEEKFDPETPDALREAMIAFFKTNPAVFELRVQLNTGLEDMPIEDNSPWSEDESQYQAVARLDLPGQTAWDREKDAVYEDMSFRRATHWRRTDRLGRSTVRDLRSIKCWRRGA